jgi:hypothetical protein
MQDINRMAGLPVPDGLVGGDGGSGDEDDAGDEAGVAALDVVAAAIQPGQRL